MFSNSQAVALYIDPPSYHYMGDRLFSPHAANQAGDNANAPFASVREFFSSRGIEVHTADMLPSAGSDGMLNIYVSLGMLNGYRKLAHRSDTVLSAFFANECPIVDPFMFQELPRAQEHFKRVYSWSDSPSLERFVGRPLRLETYRYPQAFDDVHEDIWARSDREFLVMINGNKLPKLDWQELYTERLRALEYFERFGEIALYGVGWDGPSYRVGKSWMPATLRRAQRAWISQWHKLRPDPLLEAARRAYKGVATSKRDVMGRYTFSICFENMVLTGWITEKIFDCFFSGTIPVYLGEPNIEQAIPPECFIDMRDFEDYAELRSYLKSMGPSEIQGYKDAARDFLRSPRFRPFSGDAFVDIFRGIVEEDAGVALG